MATATKKPPAAAKAAKPSKAAKAPVKAAAKAPAKSKSKKVDATPPPPAVYVSAYSVGNRVVHPTFGDGKVTAIEDDKLTIQFKAGEKVILDSFVKAGSKG